MDVVAVGMSFSDHCHAVSELHDAHALGGLGILDPDMPTRERMAVGKCEAYQPTCSTDREPCGRG